MGGRKGPLSTYLGGLVSVLLLVGAGLVYSQGRSAAELHAEAVDNANAPADNREPAAQSSSSFPSFASPGVAAPPTAGPGIDEPGTLISARLMGSDVLDVSESLRVTRSITRLTITPPDLTGAHSELDSLEPVLTDVQVSADGQVVPTLQDEVLAPLRIVLPKPAQSVEVRYLLEGAVVRSLPSRAGRALAGLAPVAVTTSEGPVAFVFGGPEIVGVSCPSLGPRGYACAGGEPGRLTVAKPLERSAALVLLQFDLPRP